MRLPGTLQTTNPALSAPSRATHAQPETHPVPTSKPSATIQRPLRVPILPDGTTHTSCGPLVVEFEVDDAFPRVTLVSMLGPSPDWFIGVSGFPLHDGSALTDDVTLELYPYDGGSRDANAFALFGPLTVPQEPISLITGTSGQLVGPGSLGTFRLQRVGAVGVPALGSGATGLLIVALLAAGALQLTRRHSAAR